MRLHTSGGGTQAPQAPPEQVSVPVEPQEVVHAPVAPVEHSPASTNTSPASPPSMIDPASAGAPPSTGAPPSEDKPASVTVPPSVWPPPSTGVPPSSGAFPPSIPPSPAAPPSAGGATRIPASPEPLSAPEALLDELAEQPAKQSTPRIIVLCRAIRVSVARRLVQRPISEALTTGAPPAHARSDRGPRCSPRGTATDR
jgi:hypothetical protein